MKQQAARGEMERQRGGPAAAAAMLLCWLMLLAAGVRAETGLGGAVLPCPGKPRCVLLVFNGTDTALPPIFSAAITNTSINEIVLAGTRYVLRSSSWTVYSQQQPFRLTRNLTIRGLQGAPVMDFSLIEKKVLLAPGVTVTFRDLVLVNVRKLGGFSLDFFMGEEGSFIKIIDSIRIKPACQLPSDVLASAKSFQRVSPAFPENSVSLMPRFCFNAALKTAEPQQQCFTDALHMQHFSMLAALSDPDKGSQYHGYVMYHDNVTRVCQATISPKCVADTNGDEELCMAMLVASAGIPGQPSKPAFGQGGGYSWTPGAAAAVAVAGGIFVVLLCLPCILRRKLFGACMHKRHKGKRLDDEETGLRPDDNGVRLGQLYFPSYTGGMAISQQVTLNTLLGAGSFGRVYKGRWHSSDVAIKIVTVRAPEELPRVLREAEVMMQLDHPNIVRAFHASVWNPAEQVKAAREARNSAGSRSQAANMAAEATAAAATSSAENNTRRNVPRRNSSLRRMPAGSASTHAGAAAAAAAVTASGNHLTTPSTSGERQQQQQQHLTSSTYLATDSSSQPLGLSGSEQIVSSSEAVAVARAADGAGLSSRGTAGLTGWLQIVPSQQQQQQQQHDAAGGTAPAVSADCASTMHPDIRSRDGQLGTSGLGSGGSGASAARAQQNQLAHCNSTGGLSADDASRQPPEAAGKASPYQQQAPADKQQQQQQHAGNLRRHLLLGWRNRPPRGSIDNSSVLDSPTAVAAAAAPAGTATGSQNGHNSGQHSGTSAAAAAAAAAAGAVVSSGGTVAIMHAPEANVSNGNRGSGGSQPSWAGTGGSSARRLEDEEGRKEQAEQQVWIILELCTGGTLLDAALGGCFQGPDAQHRQQPGGGRMELAMLLSRLLDAANGMAYLHARGIMHGDLKAGNVLLQHSIHGSYGQVAKISDFGLSAVLLNGSTHRSTASLGTITHMAPELLRNGRMSPSADVYSFGIVMWEVYCGKQAWQGLHYGVVVERVVISKERPPVPEDMPDELELLMRRCWDDDPLERPTFEQIAECLELLLDNLGSEDEGEDAVSHGSARDVLLPAGGHASAPAAAAEHSWHQQQQLAGAQQELPHRLSAPAAAPGQQQQQQAAVMALAPPAATAALAAAAAAAAAEAMFVGAAGLSAQVSPPTPVVALQVHRQQQVPYDSSGAGAAAGNTHGSSHVHSSSSQVRSSTSGNPHSSQLARQPGTAGARRASVLDDNMYLQDL